MVSVCVKKWRWIYVLSRRREGERTRITVLFRNASARCCAPSHPISFSRRFSVVSVCMKKCRWVCVLSRWREREWGLQCCFVMHHPDVLLLFFWCHCRGDLVWWVSVWKSADGYTYWLDEKREREWELRCCFVTHQPDIVLLFLQRCCERDLVSWVSVWESADGYTYCLDEERKRMRITRLFRNASARYCAPFSWILLPANLVPMRFNVVSACVKKCRWVYVLSRWREGGENEDYGVVS